MKQIKKHSKSKIRIISGKWKNRKIEVLDEINLRPTKESVRETLFNWLRNDIENASTIDLFAGTGALTFEALSRNAKLSLACESNLKILKKLKETKNKLIQDDNINLTLINKNAYKMLNFTNEHPFNIVFIDPPFNEKNIEEILTKLISNNWIQVGSLIYLETDISGYELQEETKNKFEQIRYKKNKKMQYELLNYIG